VCSWGEALPGKGDDMPVKKRRVNDQGRVQLVLGFCPLEGRNARMPECLLWSSPLVPTRQSVGEVVGPSVGRKKAPSGAFMICGSSSLIRD